MSSLVSVRNNCYLLLSQVETGAGLLSLLSVGGVDTGPGEGVLEGSEQVDEGPGNDHIVVEGDGEGGEHGGESDTGEAGVDSTEHTNITTLELLTERELEHEHGDTEEEEADQVGDEEKSTTPLEAEVRETPEVTKTNGGSNGGQDEGVLIDPSLSRLIAVLLIITSEESNKGGFVGEG